MAKDFARGEHMMRRATPIKVDRENDTPTKQGGPNTPSWQNRSYGWKALESDTMPPIPEHFRTGSWMNRFSGQSPQTEPNNPDKADPKQNLIAFGDEAITQDPITGLFVVIVGGIIAGTVKTFQEAQKLYDQVMKSTHDHGGGKNGQHGKSKDKPSDLKELAELQKQLEGANSKDKKKISLKIRRLREKMAERRKGKHHSQRNKK